MTTTRSRVRSLLGCALLVSTVWSLASPALAQGLSDTKIARDLKPYLDLGVTLAAVPWAKNVQGATHVKVLIVAGSADPELASLRADVLARGGSVLYNYLSVRALAAMLPTAAIAPLAARADVVSISPNRAATRHASLLQDSAGAGPALPPLVNGALPRAMPTGAGVAIAVLDSGIDWSHRSLQWADGTTRVRGAVDFVAIGRQTAGDGWGKGQDYSPSTKASIYGSKYTKGDKDIAPSADRADSYGHGTDVASIAAGWGAYQSPDSTGLAVATPLYDVRVLDDKGVGNMADVLAGID